MNTREGIARLTEREKACLRPWLAHRTAKQIALELGISHHAVEKRLKVARTKLGVASTLEAARLLAAAEGSGSLEYQAAEVAAQPVRPDKRKGLVVPMGVLAVMIAISAGVLFLLTDGPVELGPVELRPVELGPVELEPAELEPAELEPAELRQAEAGGLAIDMLLPGHVAATTPEIYSIMQTTFRHLDADRSGFLEGEESPLSAPSGPQPVYRRDADGNEVPTREMVEHSAEQVLAQFYGEADTDGDGRVSLEEYFRWSAPRLARQGIPAEWKAEMNRPVLPGG